MSRLSYFVVILAGFTYGKGSFSEAILWWVRIYNEFEGEITLNMLMFCELITKATQFKATGMISLIRIRVYELKRVTSLERIRQYTTIEQEPEPRDDSVPPAYWPSSGRLEVEKLTAKYSPVSDLCITGC